MLPYRHLVSAFLTWYHSSRLGALSVSRSIQEGEMATDRPHPLAINTKGKLDGKNYPLWKLKMMVILQSFDLWDTAIGDDKEPQPTRDSMGNVTSLADPTVVLGWKH